MIQKSIRGVIRGRTIEFESEPGFAEGEEVDVVVHALEARREVGSIRDEEAQATDEIDWVQQARKVVRCPE